MVASLISRVKILGGESTAVKKTGGKRFWGCREKVKLT
jgi:hypothetical protein